MWVHKVNGKLNHLPSKCEGPLTIFLLTCKVLELWGKMTAVSSQQPFCINKSSYKTKIPHLPEIEQTSDANKTMSWKTKRYSESKQWTVLLFGLLFKCFITCLSARGKSVWDNASDFHTLAKGACVPCYQVWVGREIDGQKRRESALLSSLFQHVLGILGPWNDLRRGPLSCNCQKLCEAKPSKTYPAPGENLLSRFLWQEKENGSYQLTPGWTLRCQWRKGCCRCRHLKYRSHEMAELGSSHNEKDSINTI